MDDITDLQCVECSGSQLRWHRPSRGTSAETLSCTSCGVVYTKSQGILRMVPHNSVLRRAGQAAEAALKLDDGLQADYWNDDSHGFRPPRHPIVRYFAEQRWAYLASQIDIASVTTALDVGCGDGFSTLYAPSHLSLTACDGSLTMLRRHLGARRLQADAFRLPFRNGAFDLVFAWELLHHVSSPHEVLAEMARVSRKWVVCCEPNPLNPAQFLFACHDPAHRWVLRFSKRYMVRQAEQAGLSVVHFSRGGCLFPNRTPSFLFKLLKFIPYRIPIVGISNCLIAEKRDPARPIASCASERDSRPRRNSTEGKVA